MNPELRYEDKVRAIYQFLRRMEFPPLYAQEDVSSEEDVQSVSVKGIMLKIGKYIQGTGSRIILLEWLISLYKPVKGIPKSTQSKRIENLVVSLGQMGLLPVSNHTKNMDYNKYVEGLLGFESAVTLIHRLCLFVKKLKENRNREKPDYKIVSLVSELCQNRETLVNERYDPFGIKFPQAFHSLSDVQFSQKYSQFLSKLQSRQQSQRQYQPVDQSFTSINKQTKQRFKTTLAQLIGLSKQVVDQPCPKPEQPQRSRLLEMDGQFVNIYRKFIQFITFEEERSSGFRESVQGLKRSLNQL